MERIKYYTTLFLRDRKCSLNYISDVHFWGLMHSLIPHSLIGGSSLVISVTSINKNTLQTLIYTSISCFFEKTTHAP